MVSSNKVIKITAKTALRDKWIKAIFSVCILLFSFFIISNSMSVLSLVTGETVALIIMCGFILLLIAPLFLGVIRCFWRLLFNVDDSPVAVFYYFSDLKKYKRAVVLIFSFTFRFILWSLIFNIPYFIVELISNNFIYDIADMPIPVWTANLSYIATFFRIVSFTLVCFIMLKFYLAPMLLVADDNIEPAEAIHMSAIISKKTSIDFIYLIFSFAGWIMLSVTVIPLIFTLPYFITSYLVHSRFAVADYNKHIKQFSENTFPSFTI